MPGIFYFTILTCGIVISGLSLRLEMLYKPSLPRSIAAHVLQLIPAIFVNLANQFVAGFLLGNADTNSDPVLRNIHPVAFTRVCKLTGIASTVLISSGVSNLYDSNLQKVARGYQLVRGGLYLQLSFTAAFLIFLVILYISPALRLLGRKDIHPLLISVFSSTVLMLGRYIFRAVLFEQGVDGNASSHEVFTYCFDILFVFLAVGMHTYCHIGRFFNGREALRPCALTFMEAFTGSAPADTNSAVAPDVESSVPQACPNGVAQPAPHAEPYTTGAAGAAASVELAGKNPAGYA